MNYFGASINQSPTVAEKAGEAISNGEFLSVKYNEDGNVVICNAEGDMAAGILLPETSKTINIGDDVTVQIKDIGLGMSGSKINKGEELTSDSKGRLISASSGNFVLGYAVSSSEKEDELIRIDIRKSGWKA